MSYFLYPMSYSTNKHAKVKISKNNGISRLIFTSKWNTF